MPGDVFASALVPDATPLGWLVLIGLVLLAAGLLPAAAAMLRACLPQRPADRSTLPPLRLGFSEKARRSPRHAVSAHRSFLTAMFTASIGLLLLAFMPALPLLGQAGVGVAIGVVLPTLLVVWHGRRRDFRIDPEAAPKRGGRG
jgi:hypothetical protein